MNIMFVGMFSTDTSWGYASNDCLKCLETQFSNIKTVDFFHGGPRKEVGKTYASKYYNNRYDKYDVLIQMCLPQFFYKDHRFKQNVGIFFSECHHDNKYVAASRLRLLDTVIVASDFEKRMWEKTHDNVHSVGLPIIKDSSRKNVLDDIKKNEAAYVFYNIAEDNERKNLDDLIRAYFIAFSKNDNVILLLKTSENSNLKLRIEEIKRQLRTRMDTHYPPVAIITDKYDDKVIQDIHNSCNCFVTTARGESWCYPCADAMMHGNHIIAPEGLKLDYLKLTDNISLIDSYVDACKVSRPPTYIHYTGYDEWSYVSVSETAKAMKEAYNRKLGNRNPGRRLYEAIESHYGYKAIGEKMKKAMGVKHV